MLRLISVAGRPRYYLVAGAAIAVFLFLLRSATALTNEEANAIKDSLLHGGVSALTVACPEILDQTAELTCAFALRVIINDFEEHGYLGHDYCPPPGTNYGSLFDTIIRHVRLNRPIWTERAVDVVLTALIRAYPCGGPSMADVPGRIRPGAK